MNAKTNLSDRTRAFLSVFLVLFVIALLLLTAEGLIRVRQYVKFGTTEKFEDLYKFDEVTGLRVPVPLTKTQNLSINSMGFRGPELKDPLGKGIVRVAYLGASTTYSAEVSSDAMTWPHLVNEALRTHFPAAQFDYVNGGVPGYSVETSRRNFQKRVAPLNPNVVVIYHGTNDLSIDLRRVAKDQGIEKVSLQAEASWLAKYSVLWHLVEKNLDIYTAQRLLKETKGQFRFHPEDLGNSFRNNLLKLITDIRDSGVDVIALGTFSTQLRSELNDDQLKEASKSASYFVPFVSPRQLIEGFAHYNQIIRDVARESRVILIDGENSIPADTEHFADAVHFKDAGSVLQASRVTAALESSPDFLALLSNVNP